MYRVFFLGGREGTYKCRITTSGRNNILGPKLVHFSIFKHHQGSGEIKNSLTIPSRVWMLKLDVEDAHSLRRISKREDGGSSQAGGGRRKDEDLPLGC